MARKAIMLKTENRKKKATRQHKAGGKITHPTRIYNRCGKCGRIGGYMRRFDLCRICFRELASNGKIMGVKKSSW